MQGLHGGKTCAESPASMTLPTAQLLQLRAEKAKGLDRSVSMQSRGNGIGWLQLFGILAKAPM